MFFSVVIAILVGIAFGVVTGLIPGVHVNLIAVLMLSVSSVLLEYTSALYVCTVIIAMAVTHTFLDTIPSVFLGAPEAETVLSILPGHRLLLEGRGVEAVLLTVVGSLGGLVLASLFVPFILQVVETVYSFVRPAIGWILVAVCAFMILRDQKKLWALFLFVLSGVLGIVVLDLPLEEPLFPFLSGLFGVSMRLMSLSSKVSIPPQMSGEIGVENTGKAVGVAVLIGWFASFLPGLGPAQAAVLGSEIVSLTERGFLILVGGLSTVNMVLSLVTFFVLEKARNGAVVAVSALMSFSAQDFSIFICVALIAGGVATLLAISLSKVFSSLLTKVDYQKVCLSVISLIFVLVTVLTGWLGIMVLVVSTAVGLIPAIKEISRSHMMGCLLVPVIGYFLF